MTPSNTPRTPAGKQDAQWLLEAAQKIDAREVRHSCTAIASAYVIYGPGYLARWHLREEYERLFSPRSGTFGGLSWGMYWGNKRRACRVLALLLASAMAETGDL